MKLQKPHLLVIDTPNLLRYHEHVKGQLKRNMIAFINFLTNSNHKIFCIFTPLMEKLFPKEIEWLKILVESKNGEVIYSGYQDPDIVVLAVAEENNAVILSNDKFRQEKYKVYSSRENTVNFRINNSKIVLTKKIKVIV